ncbi:MAG TPA: hypothetical protein VE975_04575 [Actinomycetota bacterium]|jgi:hypothetical protein|nr:hypothetical protein [Actinomycetota bacterium]
MKAFGFVTLIVGACLFAVSAKAISDPMSPPGWSRGERITGRKGS